MKSTELSRLIFTVIASSVCGWLLAGALISDLTLREAAACAAIAGLCLALRDA